MTFHTAAGKRSDSRKHYRYQG